MEFVEVMKRAQEMCKDFAVCSNCPIYYAGSYSCWFTLLNDPDKAERAIIDYLLGKRI